MNMIMEYLPMALEILGGLVLAATVAVRLTPSVEDDAKLNKFAEIFFKIVSYLPTLGINPRTKKLEEAYKQMVDKK